MIVPLSILSSFDMSFKSVLLPEPLIPVKALHPSSKSKFRPLKMGSAALGYLYDRSIIFKLCITSCFLWCVYLRYLVNEDNVCREKWFHSKRNYWSPHICYTLSLTTIICNCSLSTGTSKYLVT